MVMQIVLVVMCFYKHVLKVHTELLLDCLDHRDYQDVLHVMQESIPQQQQPQHRVHVKVVMQVNIQVVVLHLVVIVMQENGRAHRLRNVKQPIV